MQSPIASRSRSDLDLVRWSLVIVWFGSGITSLLERHGQGSQLLQGTAMSDPWVQQISIWAGATLDLSIGVGMVLWPCRRMFDLALAAMVLLTLVATWLSPSLWLHPLGPLLKNIPIAAALWLLRSQPPKHAS